MTALWQFILDNQTTLSWLGGGVVVVAGGIWSAVTMLPKREPPKSVSADTGVAAGRDIRGNTITIHGRAEAERALGQVILRWIGRRNQRDPAWAVTAHTGVAAIGDISNCTISINDNAEALAALAADQERRHRELMEAVAREKGVDPKLLVPLFEHLGHSGLTLDEIRIRAGEAIEAMLALSREKPTPSNQGGDIDAAIASARARLGRLDTAGAVSILDAKIAEEEAARRQRTRPASGRKGAGRAPLLRPRCGAGHAAAPDLS